jgi:DNA-binding CsgD family transcriptional regulator
MNSAITALETMTPESRCVKCDKRIRKGHPRFVVSFMEFGIGPGHPAFSQEAFQEDRVQNESFDGGSREFGLLSSSAFAFCEPCSGEISAVANPWHSEREERAAGDPGGSVWAVPISQIRVSNDDDVDEDHKFNSLPGRDDKAVPSPARAESEDRFLSGSLTKAESRSSRNGRSLFTEDDRRHRMVRFLLTGASGQLKPVTREVCKLWSEGMKQKDVAEKCGMSQPTVQRHIRAADAIAENYSRQSKNS